MPNFTNSKWSISRLGYKTIFIGSGRDGCNSICTVCEQNRNREADARLICAAPDLYEALEEIAYWCERLDLVRPQTAKARAALSKVIGDQNEK